MKTKWIFVAVCVTILFSFGDAKKNGKFDENGSRKNLESSEETGSHEPKLNHHLTRAAEKDHSTFDRNEKKEKYDEVASKECSKNHHHHHPHHHQKTKKDHGEALEDDRKERKKRETSKPYWDDIEAPRAKTMKVKKKELLIMDQEYTGADGGMMPPFERESDIEQLRAQTLPPPPLEESVVPLRKSKTIKKYNPEETRRKKFEKEKAGKNAKIDKVLKEKRLFEDNVKNSN